MHPDGFEKFLKARAIAFRPLKCDYHVICIGLHILAHHGLQYFAHQTLATSTMNVVLFSSSGRIHILLYPEKASIKLRKLQTEALSTKVYMLGKGYKYLGKTVFKSMKSTHIIHLLLVLFTITMLASQSGYWIFLIWLAFTNFLVSS